MSANLQKGQLKQVIRSEFVKCVKNPAYFMKKYCQIQHPIRGKISFNLYDFQERVLVDFIEHDYNIILKARQLGISTLVAGYSVWLALFHKMFSLLLLNKIRQKIWLLK